ncbi:pseudouridine synthase [Limibacter armeniacum]|uniref:pseudouridine synthase n=1 Tax=Limibacter armeniacum TaxID=466084 RepID=UPI002FE6B8C3
MSKSHKDSRPSKGKSSGKGLKPFAKFIKKKDKKDDTSFSERGPKKSSHGKKTFKKKIQHLEEAELLKSSFSKKDKVKGTPTYNAQKFRELEKQNTSPEKETRKQEGIRLNRYVSNSGVCSRREADSLIANGEIKVNGKVVTEMGYKVKPNEVVSYQGKKLHREKLVYVLLNKPKGFITTTKDPEERKTVMSLVENACDERIYPIGRLDRATTGLLLFTNDGDFAKKMAHPSGNTHKIYYVELDRPITEEDEDTIRNRKFELEDGPVDLDGFSVHTTDRRQIGVELHSGRNRIVRRIFEHFNYRVEKLDRTVLAGLTKKDLPRGRWRFLTEQEIIRLKYMQK